MTIERITIEGEDDLHRLVARSRLLGADTTLVVHGGGNTSTKSTAHDHRGRERPVLLIKGSGSDLASAGPGDFPVLFLDDLVQLRERDAMTDEDMVAYLAHCMADPGGRRPSIETLLHAFLPAKHVDHVHADAVCALTNTSTGRRAVAEALGDDVAYVEYVRPGFDLSKRVADLASSRAVVLAHHGLVTWGDTPEASYGLTLELVERAEAYLLNRGARRLPSIAQGVDDAAAESVLPPLRGRLSRSSRKVLRVDPTQLGLADRPDVDAVAAAGPATADHILRLTGGGTAVVRELADVDRWSARYRDYFRARKDRVEGGHPMHEPMPRSMLVPGIGSVAAGRTVREARVVSDVAARSHEVAALTIDAHGSAEPLPDDDLFAVDYWALELYKLALQPPPLELAGTVAVVTGAASGIGRVVAGDLAARGACLVLADRDEDGIEATVAGLEAVDRDQVETVGGDLSEEAVVDAVVRTAVRTFGGLDAVVFNAGIGMTGRLNDLTPAQWRLAIEVNATAAFLLTRRVWSVLERQGCGGSLVYNVSKNAFAPGAGFGAYSASKAAELQLCRIAALEGGPVGIRANAVNPDAVFEDSKLWSPELRAERAAAHGVAPAELEAFYAKRNLLGARVTSGDVAEAVAYLVSDRSKATTGCVITVDGGVAGAFPR